MPPAAQFEPLHQQLDAWLRLAEAIERSQQALLQGNLAEIEHSTKVQTECCQYCEAAGLVMNACVSAYPPEVGLELRARIQQVRLRVRHLNRVHADLLRRANRSLRILRNLLSGSGAAYGPPQALDQPLLSGERG